MANIAVSPALMRKPSGVSERLMTVAIGSTPSPLAANTSAIAKEGAFSLVKLANSELK